MKKVIVIGSGIVGAMTSYELAKSGCNVIIIDDDKKGSATRAAAGMINPWTTKRRNKAWYALATKGAALYPELVMQLEEDGEYDTGYKQVGAIHLHTDAEKLKELERIVHERRKTIKEIGDISLLDERDVREFFPLIGGSYRGLFISGAGRVDGRELTSSLCRAAKKYGAIKLHGHARLWQEKDVIVGVQVNGERIEADAVVAANGVWMKNLLADINIQTSITIQKGKVVVLQTDIQTDHLPVVMPLSNKYILPFDHGKMMIGTTFTKASIDELEEDITIGGLNDILQNVLEFAPGLANATISDVRIGYRPYTLNHLPLFGQVPCVKGLYAANGLGASGLSTGLIIGNQLANLLNDQPLEVDIRAYRMEHMINN